MIFEADPVDLDIFTHDVSRPGYIRVLYRNNVVWARPLHPMGQVMIPSREFMDAYVNRDDTSSKAIVYVTHVNDSPNHLMWLGLRFFRGGTPVFLQDNPHRNVLYSVDFVQFMDDAAARWAVEHDSGSTVFIQRGDDPTMGLRDPSGAFLTVKPNGPNLGNSSGDLRALLLELIGLIKVLTVTSAPPGTPTSPPIDQVSLAALEAKVRAVFHE